MKYQSIVIGFGKGGKTLAAELAKNGERVAVIEKSDKMFGGTCINVGCIPSKSFVKNAEKMDTEASFEEKAKRYNSAVGEKNELTTMLRGKNYDKLNQFSNLDIIVGTAEFIDNKSIKVTTNDGELLLEADKFFVNTGSTPFVPGIEGVKENPNILLSEDLLALEELPENLTIIGGGYIGLEFASMYSAFGSKVRMLVVEDEFIPREDRDIAQSILEAFEAKGVEILLSVKTKKFVGDSVYYEKDGVEKVIENTKILMATGRKANTQNLGLEKAGVELTERGLIKVDETLKTTAPNIWAMGDVCNNLQFTYISLDDYRVISSQFYGDGEYKTSSRKNVPYSVFISPSFSRVGLNEKEALEQGYNIKVFKMPTAAIPKAQVLKKTQGMLKAIVDMDTEKILGAMLFCEESHEVINIVKVVMDLEGSYKTLKNTIFTHPTMAESLNDLFQ